MPYPAAVDDHQTANARGMVEAGAAAVLSENNLSDKSLAELLREWLVSRDSLLTRARQARSLAQPDALGRITTLCLEAAGEPGS